MEALKRTVSKGSYKNWVRKTKLLLVLGSSLPHFLHSRGEMLL
jgi:hypothetical protein